jgi:hypothetical protein
LTGQVPLQHSELPVQARPGLTQQPSFWQRIPLPQQSVTLVHDCPASEHAQVPGPPNEGSTQFPLQQSRPERQVCPAP